MRVLWVCNRCLPVVAAEINMDAGNKEGWLAGLSERILEEKNGELTLGVCFPAKKEMEHWQGEFALHAYAFYEDTSKPELYNDKLEARMREIVADFKPDVVHIFGTEFPHTLAMVKAFDRPERTLIGIQGMCTLLADAYLIGLPEQIVKRSTLRDMIKSDSIIEQQKKFYKRGMFEQKALSLTGNVTGRTDLDKEYSMKCNPRVKYFFMNETLRSNFYQGNWSSKNCEKHSVFVSQGDYPIKGLHLMLQAFPAILDEYPDAKIYVAGNCITGDESISKKIKIASYGKYLKELMEKSGIQDKVIFLGNLNAEAMKEQFLKCNVYVSCSTMENSPNSVGEAMLLGVPVVASNVGGVSSILTDMEEGILYEATNIKELSHAVLKVFDAYEYEDPSKMRPMRVKEEDVARVRTLPIKARERAYETHNPAKNYKRLMEIYEEICGIEE
ncbi:MAG: glycosyltransferase family 4 protein [Lachnospiraceae bacterium]|nr:glycosyltransferase family 4 protein [Lachnospiraceae bacterium]